MEKQQQTRKKELKRSLGVASVFAICTGAAFSSGFFLLPGFAADETGPSLPIAFLVAGILMLPAIFSMSELSSAMPRAGGPYYFLTRSFGPFLGIIGALGKYLQLLFKGAFAFVGAGAYFNLIAGVSEQAVAIGLIVIFTLVNLMGIKQTALTEKILVGILILLLSYFLVAGILQIRADHDIFPQRFQPLLPFGIEGFVSAIALVFVSYGGMGQVASMAEEIKHPSRSIPKGMLWALAVATFFYVAGTSVMMMLLSPGVIQDDKVPVATVAAQITQIPLPVTVIVVAALAAFSSTGNAAILSAARYPLALSRDQLLWKKFGELGKNGIPTNAVLVTGMILIGLTLLFDVRGIAKMASAFLLFIFFGMCLSLIIFRESKIQDYQPNYLTPFYPWAQIIGIIIYLFLIIISGWKAVLFIIVVCIVSAVWYFVLLKNVSSFSAAVYPLFERFARSEKLGSFGEEANIHQMQGLQLYPLVDRAIFIDLVEESSFDDVVIKATDAIKERLGGERKKINQILHEEVKHWLHPVRFNISVAPVLLQGIEQPEMIIIRGKIPLKETTVNGLIVVVDDENSPERLIKLMSQLNEAINKTDFPEKWEHATSAKEIKDAIKQTIRTISLRVDASEAGKKLVGKKIKEIELPEGALIAIVKQDGHAAVPGPEMEIKDKDEIVVITEPKAFEELAKRFDLRNTRSFL